jgi:hypothetical protein
MERGGMMLHCVEVADTAANTLVLPTLPDRIINSIAF